MKKIDDMESKFHENGIITGIADSFCLPCQKYLKLKDISEHISEPAHEKTFQSTNYVEKYKEDRIRKVKLGYYCEICNMMIQTLAKSGMHVNEVSHMSNKNNQELKESEVGIVAFDDILIENNAWHGLSDGSCLICNVDYTDEDEHKNEPMHILKLIQSKFELNKNRFVYRKIDDDSINCLICNTIITEKSKEKHIDESEHKKNYSKCQKDKETKLEIAKNDNYDKNNLEKNCTSNDVITETTDSKKDSAKREVFADGLNSEAQEEVNNKLVVKQIENTDNDEILTPIQALKRAKEFAKQNNLNYKRNSTYCKVCDVRISSSLKMMKEHVAESSHKEKAANKTTRKMEKVPSGEFIKSTTTVENFFCHDIIINDEFCITFLSFCMISTYRGMLRCQACEVSMNLREVNKHIISFKHHNAMETKPVITDFESEFVREVRPRVYHCGYCNFIEASLENMKNHLKSINHSEMKSSAKRRHQSHIPDIMAHKTQREFHNFMRMFMNL